ncbi:4-hydroxy-tetrahydrodipicolinate reductase [Puniceicoccaceae bacterium K14]|nr:4-hydroxy-tetrahydrodipicolinate reductase [Puniceicoccaceae bacterium K14]
MKVAINGANGKMGRLAQTALGNAKEFEIVGLWGRGDDLAGKIEETKPAVVIDFTLASVVSQNTRTIIEKGVCPVIGTSGLKKDELATFANLCASNGGSGLVVPNFSITAVLMMKYAQDAARYIKNVELVEFHHEKKEESPSGTALKTIEMMSESHLESRSRGEELFEGSLGGQYLNVPVHSVRMPGFVAAQEVIFGSEGETLVLKSSATNRDAFKNGIRLACLKAPSLGRFASGLEHVL